MSAPSKNALPSSAVPTVDIIYVAFVHVALRGSLYCCNLSLVAAERLLHADIFLTRLRD